MDHPPEVHQSLVAQNPSDGDGMIASPVPSASSKPRIIGVDVARCLALFGMIAAHVFEIFNDDGTPTASTVIAGGRSAATFVVVAGVSVAFLSGGRTVVQGRRRTAAAAGLAVRALLVGAIGLALGLAAAGGVDVILPVYAVMFLLAIPLLGMPPRVLAGIAAAVIVLGPILLVATAGAGLPYFGADAQPTLATLVRDPFGLLVLLFITGAYPVVAYLAYLCAGMAIGRCDLSSRLVAWRLLGGGLALAVIARVVSAVLLYPLGGLAHLTALPNGLGGEDASAQQQLLWEPHQLSSWWYLALPSPHANTPLDLVHTLGSAMAVLGASLLLTQVPALMRVLRPLAIAGSMTLTLYCTHVLIIAIGFLGDEPVLLYLLMVTGTVGFALVWRRRFEQGPLERLIAELAGRTRRAVAHRYSRRRDH